MGDYDEAEEALLLIQNDKYCADPIYQSWLVRCFIAKGKARMAWERYLRMETSEDSFTLLQVRGMCAGCLVGFRQVARTGTPNSCFCLLK